jgi:hypothetical protein
MSLLGGKLRVNGLVAEAKNRRQVFISLKQAAEPMHAWRTG